MYGNLIPIDMTLYTDSYIVHGRAETRFRRITDLLNQSDYGFIVLHDASLREYGSQSAATSAEFAQVNLTSVLFAVADDPVGAVPELRIPKVSEQALITLPPFKIVGRIHLLPERSLGEALNELVGRFVPVTDAAYWAESIGEPRRTAAIVAVNHERTQILAPHHEGDAS